MMVYQVTGFPRTALASRMNAVDVAAASPDEAKTIVRALLQGPTGALTLTAKASNP